jgi:ubiquinone/menaquinone biosynthesis C-methylase UbiE
MTIDIIKELNYNQLRRAFIKYTIKAFQMLPEMDKPRILDIGCGSGIPTIELARLSKGEIIGIDIDQAALDELSEKAQKLGISNRVKAINCSLFELDFPEESFDIIWAEGAIAPIGFERALKEWGRVLKINGNMVFHDDLGVKEKKIEIIPKYGYKLVDYFQLPDDAWWVDYYEHLEKRIKELRTKHNDDPKILEAVKSYQNEINSYKKNPKNFRSIFYIIKKISK